TRVAGTAGSFDLHRVFLADPGTRYRATSEGRAELEGRPVHVIHMEPLVETPYREARVWIDAEELHIRKLEVEEESESLRTVELTSIRLNPTMEADRFAFVPPPGVQVITR